MRFVPALRGYWISALMCCFALAVFAPAGALAQQSAPEAAAPDLKIDLPGGQAPAPAPAKKSGSSLGRTVPANAGGAITVIGPKDGAVEIVVPQTPAATPAPRKAPAQAARPAAEPAPKPLDGGARAPVPFAPATGSASGSAPGAATAATTDPAVQPDRAAVPFDAAPAPPAPSAPVAPAGKKTAPFVAAPAPAKAQPPVAARPGQKGRQAKTEEVRPAMVRRLGEMSVGALLPLSGKYQSRGQVTKAALEIASQDIGEYLAKAGVAGSFAITIEDTQSDPKTALERLKGLAVRGVKVVIGPDNDDEVAEVREFAKTNDMLLLSPGSAGPFLAKKEGELLRFAPMNTHQAEAAAGLASQEGVDALVPFWEGELYGDELVVHLKAHFRNMGGTALAGVRYRPGTTHFGGHLADLKSQIEKAQKQFKKVAVYYAGREGIADILKEADKLGLTAVRWYGCDASAMTPELTRDEAVAELAQKARLVSPRYGETETDAYAALEKRIQEKSSEFPVTESVVAYDIAWLAAMTGLVCGGLDHAPVVKAALPPTAERLHGVSGWLALDENGDRREDWGYDFWSVKRDKGKFYWEKFARYQFQPGGTKQYFINHPE